MQKTKLWGIIFDMDGTIIDNMMVHHKIWHKLLNQLDFKITLDEVKKTIHGKNEEIFKRLFGTKFSADEIKKLCEQKENMYRDVYKNDIILVDGFRDFLNMVSLHNIPLSIGTAAPQKNVDFIIQKLNIASYFVSIIHADMVRWGKPHPEVFLRSAQNMQLSPSDIIVFEDSPTGAQTAANANMKSIILLTTHQKNEFDGISGIQKFIHSYNEIDFSSLDAMFN